MNILAKIKEDLKKAMKCEVEKRNQGISDGEMYDMVIAQKTVSRAIISMFPELGIKPDKATDDDTIKLLKKYITSEKTRELYQQKILTKEMVEGLSAKDLNTLTKEKINELGDNLTSYKIFIAQSYLPKEASSEEIEMWIKDNIDFSQFKNKMQAMGPIMTQFKGADGNTVKQILSTLEI